MTSPPKLTEKQIHNRASAQSFAKGQSYYRSGAVFDTIRRGDQLEGYCEGSQPCPYRILVTLDRDGISSAFRTCPYDWGGDCKHIVAGVEAERTICHASPVKLGAKLLRTPSPDDLRA